MNLRLFIVFTIPLLATAHPAVADNREGAFTLSPFAGAQGFPFGGETHYDGDFDWGVRAGYNFTMNVRLELVFGENKTVHDPEVAYCTIHQYGADILYAFMPETDFVPFVSAGFGVFDVKFRDKGTLPDDTNPYFNYGVGFEYTLTSWLAFRTEFHHAVMLDTGDNALQGSIGFTIRFGGR